MIHIGIIPDGNRRWCKKNNYRIDELVSHWSKLILDFLKKNLNRRLSKYLKSINEVSFYVCSIDNINRTDNTKYLIFDFIRFLYEFYKNPEDVLKKYNIPYKKENIENCKKILKDLTINFIGDLKLLPEDIQHIHKNIIKNNDINNKYTLNLAIAYDYNKDILNFGRSVFKNYVRKQSNIDLILRSGGEYRTSGFFPTKILYSELFFFKKIMA